MIPDQPILPTKYTNLLTNHIELDLEDVLRFEKSYINSPTRAAQDTNMLYHCLILLALQGRQDESYGLGRPVQNKGNTFWKYPPQYYHR